MKESKPQSPNNSVEKYSRKEVFEHLFPGNKFKDLPEVSTLSISVFAKLYISEWMQRQIRFMTAEYEGIKHVEREELKHPDKISMLYFTVDLTPIDGPTHPTYFKGTSFVDFVDTKKGEKLGSAAERPVKTYSNPLVEKLALKFGQRIYLDKPEIVIGILDKNDKPVGLIHFMEGDKDKDVKEKEKERVTTPLVETGISI